MKSFSHDIEDYPEGIILNIDKPYRWTSADVIRKIKYAAIRHFGKKKLKVGHAGTLDPLATGVLLVCIGPATKRAEELQKHDKEYVAGVSFGATTPSFDLEKGIDARFPCSHIEKESVEEALKAFIGEQMQVAPLFSAKSVDGVRAYELARKAFKAGEAIPEGLLRAARINISDCELLDFEVTQEADGHGIADKLNTGMPAGLRVLDCYPAVRPIRDLAYLRADVTFEYDNGVPADAAARITGI